MTAPLPAPSYFELLSTNRAYRNLWLGQLISFFGDWFRLLALYTAVQEITDSTVALALVVVGMGLPIFLVVPLAGPLIDRFDRRTLMLVTDAVRAVLTLSLVAAHRMESLPLLYLALFVMVAFSGVFIPARTASVPQLTDERELPVAMALSGGTWSVMAAVGAAVGGAAVALIGVDGAFVLDGLTYLVSFGFLYLLPPILPRSSSEPAARTGFWAGVRYVRERPYLASLLCSKPSMMLGSAAMVMVPVYGTVMYPMGGAVWLGLLYSVRGLGALVGSMGVRTVLGDHPETMRRALVPGYFVLATSMLLLGWAPTMGVAMVAMFGLAMGQGVVWVFSGTLSQLASEREFRGRIFSMEWGAMTLVMSTVSLAAGAAVDAEWATERQVVAIAGLTLFAPGLLWAGLQPWLRAHGGFDAKVPESTG